MSYTKIGILGRGEIGKAMETFYNFDVSINDIASNKTFAADGQFDIMHVCIPYTEHFVKIVSAHIQKHAMGGLVFIHSTVPVGTTEQLSRISPMVVHAPVRGVHPELVKGIKTFPMYIGADSAGAGRLASEHLESLGIQTMIMRKSKTTELMKLLDTTYYGVCISFHDYARELCESASVNFDMVMTEANRSYNAGYIQLEKPNVVRPVLRPPENGKIGGHCIIPNAQILYDQFGPDLFLAIILRHK